ncbi:response regulator receiver domain-containing protein [Saccharothrix texasensis]|uniref:Response regulator receiver domain-containing protein n=1 Tax=Saccharothrix texasensis TaxID=103734 RepID=A0A3N1H807_9PSEU|nr:response regulator receiver domain-containing protein [Saccharothrix texasensis]
MQVLLVEDSAELIDVFQHFSSTRGFDLTIATNVKSAIKLVESVEYEFDVAVCDLKMPSQEGAIDLSLDHGLEVVRRIIEVCPGVPVVVLSAFGTIDIARHMLLQANKQDVFGTGMPEAMLQYEPKSSGASGALGFLVKFQDELDSIGDVEVINGGNLTNRQLRTLRIFARRRGGRQLEYRPLSGGLSGARTGLVTVKDGAGAQVARVVSKITRIDRALEEKDRYRQCIAGRLGAGAYADLNDEVTAGCGRTAGLFYSVAESYKLDVFAQLLADESAAALAVRRMQEEMTPWLSGMPQSPKTWVDIRRELISDEKYARVISVQDVVEVPESKSLQTFWVTQHGDLHGANSLINDSVRPVLIDFGRAGQMTSVLDPITLELSVLFHADSTYREHPWPEVAQIDSWDDLDLYLAGCPYPEYVKACREWSLSVAAGVRDLYATIDAYCLRNMQYDDVNIERARALQAFAANKLIES